MSGLIKPFGKRKSRFIHPDEARRRLDEIVVPEAPDAPPDELTIENSGDRFILHNVFYRERLYTVHWSKAELGQGERRSIPTWTTLANDGWMLPNTQLCYATAQALYDHREHRRPMQKVYVEWVKQMLRNNYLFDVTHVSTIVRHAPGAMDQVIHDYNYASSYMIPADIALKKGRITPGSGLEEQMFALLGSRDLEKIEKVYFWLTGMTPHFAGLHAKPDHIYKAALLFGVDKEEFGLYEYGDIESSLCARGVRIFSKEEQTK